MLARVHASIDDVGASRLAQLQTGLDFSYGLLRAMERSLWGELAVRYATVEDDCGRLLAFTPVYVGSNLNLNALLPRAIQDGYNALVSFLGSAIETRRSEERRVGKECRSRWSPEHQKKKKKK